MLKSDCCLEVENLCVVFQSKAGLFRMKKLIKAVTNVSFQVKRGETFCLVGETGSGKTTIGRVITGLQKADSGTIFFIDKSGKSWKLDNKWPLNVQQKIQMIFQDPYSSLNPRMKVIDLLKEGIINYHMINNQIQMRERVLELLQMVGLSEDFLDRYPNQLSGGERQRIAIARALSVEPDIVVCDEVISALDVSMQILILELLKELREKLQLSYIFITHDLNAAKYLSHRIAVIYKGYFIEIASTNEIISNPLHPYTKELMKASKLEDFETTKKETTPANIANTENETCPFYPSCRMRLLECMNIKPSWSKLSNDHWVYCNFYKS